MKDKEISQRYILNSKTKKGGMSSVNIYRDEILQRDVVFKSLQKDIEESRLLDEIKALQSLRSKHVIQIYDIVRDEKNKIKYIIEEFLPGSDLVELCRKKNPPNEYLSLIYQIALGIFDIHSKNLIHRDIKPNNMKFDAEGFIKIFDFGLSREINVDDSTLGFKGSSPFAAPELYTKNKIKFTQAIDIYAFGVIAFFLTGHAPHNDLLRQPPVQPTNLFNTQTINIPQEILDLLNKSISTNPSERPSIQEIVHTIGNYLLYNKHNATLVSGRTITELNSKNKQVNISADPLGKINIEYDGIYFKVTKIIGDVFVNNIKINSGFIMPGSCVITFGQPDLGSGRVYVTFDISHPEVII